MVDVVVPVGAGVPLVPEDVQLGPRLTLAHEAEDVPQPARAGPVGADGHDPVAVPVPGKERERAELDRLGNDGDLGGAQPVGAEQRDGLRLRADDDQPRAGPPAADVGSFLARLIYGRHLLSLSRRREEQLARCFLDGYAAVRQVPAYWSVRWHTAAALLNERTLRAVNRVRPAALDRLADLLAEGLALASGGREGGR